jgi:hypothetical protein
MRKKLTLNRETVRLLASRDLAHVQGGNSQGGACDTTVGKTQCDLQGCAGFAACSDTCGVCDPPQSQPQSCQGCTND